MAKQESLQIAFGLNTELQKVASKPRTCRLKSTNEHKNGSAFLVTMHYAFPKHNQLQGCMIDAAEDQDAIYAVHYSTPMCKSISKGFACLHTQHICTRAISCCLITC